MKKLSILLWLLVLLPGGVLAAQPDKALIRAMDEAGFSTNQVSRVRNIIKTTGKEGLPADAVSSKVHEGIAKNIDPDRIIHALEQVKSRYEYGYSLAHRITREKTRAAKLGNTVTAGIAAGLSRQDAEKLVQNLQAKSNKMNSRELYQLAEESMRTARDMSRQGVSSATTAEVIGKAVQKGFTAHDMHTMRTTFDKQAIHANRESLAGNYGTAIEHGVTAKDLSKHGSGSRGHGTHGTGDGTEGGNDGGSDSSGGGGHGGDGGDSGGDGHGGDGGGSGGDGHGGGGDSGGGGHGGGGGDSDGGGHGGGGHH